MTDAPDNMRHWSELSKTDPVFTKPFKRAGGFAGTDINPTWRIKRMTERFGPAGMGWGMTEPAFDMVQEEAGRVVYCRVGIWYRDGDQKSDLVWGVGGDIVSGRRKSGDAFVDDEAQKKAFTDALGNAMKAIGVSADVFLKQFDDSKYREESGAFFAAKANPDLQPAAIEAFEADVKTRLAECHDTASLDALWKSRVGSRLREIGAVDRPAFDRITALFAEAKKRITAAKPANAVAALAATFARARTLADLGAAWEAAEPAYKASPPPEKNAIALALDTEAVRVITAEIDAAPTLKDLADVWATASGYLPPMSAQQKLAITDAKDRRKRALMDEPGNLRMAG